MPPPPLHLRILPSAGTNSATPSTSNVSNSTLKSRKFRERLKENLRNYRQFCIQDALKSRLYRAKMNEQQRAHYNQQSKMRMRRKRQKDKEEREKRNDTTRQCVPKSKPRITTRAEKKKLEETRARDRQRKREKRASMTRAEIEEENKLRRQRRLKSKLDLEAYRQLNRELTQKRKQLQEERKQLEEKERSLEEEVKKQVEMEVQKVMQNENTKAAKRKSISRAFKGLPKSPQKFADTVANVIEKATPRKKAALEAHGIAAEDRKLHQNVSVSMAEYLRSLKRSRKKDDLFRKRLLIQRMPNWKKNKLQRKACRHFGLTSSAIKKAKTTMRAAHKRAISSEVKQDVVKFYEDSALQLPDKKLISKKTLKKTGFLQQPITILHSQFKAKHPTAKIGLKTFYSLRPRHIKPVSAIKYRGCLCEYCCNAELKIDALNKIAHSHKQQSIFQGVYGISQITMCPKENSKKYHQRACIERKCKDCGTERLDFYAKNLEQQHQNKPMTWYKWEKTVEEVKGKEVVKQQMVTKSGTITACLEELKPEVCFLSQHLFNASWQNEQFSNIRANIPKRWVVMVHDFAENFVCTAQDEIQSAHWNHSTATVHPVVCYYMCPNCPETLEESLVFITPDKKHDYHAVHAFMAASVQHLKTKLGSTEIQQIVRFSDGAACQYKSRGPFLDVAMAVKEYSIPTTYHYFGSRHGKGPSDGESAVVKRQASQAIIAGVAVINNARDLFEFTKQIEKKPVADECLHFQRKAFFVENIRRDRGHEQIDLKTLKGTRKLHSITGNANGQVSTRNLSCFCKPCITSVGSCLNKDYVDEVKHAVIFTKTPTSDATAVPSSVVDSNLRMLSVHNDEDELENDGMSESATCSDQRMMSSEVQEGDWVSVTYDDMNYPGIIKKKVDGEFLVSVMVSTGKQLWKWPAIPDCIWYKKDHVLHKLEPPDVLTSRGVYKFQRKEP